MEEKLMAFINLIIAERSEQENQSQIEELKSDFSLRDDLHLSSLELASLTVLIEDEFEVDVFEDGIVTTVGEILAIIKGKG